MGWGSALLGYARPEISRSIADYLQCGAVLSLPHELEAEVTRRLIELIPCADMVLFGKNGSDVCNAAVRAARLATGRRVVLFSGYHGWQDPFAEVFEPALAPPGGRKEVFRFGLGDLDALSNLVSEHSGEIAAVMLEPAAQVEGVDGPVRDADPDFLRMVAEICHGESAVLIFDEIMTGFRFRCGSVQQGTGVVPDLACFGKALSSGMPLSALVGRRDVLAPVLSRMFYHPTFKGEAYSFAAALAALNIYQQEDVPGRIQTFGNRLMEGVNRISDELGVDGGMVGLPYRMVYKFNEKKEDLRTYMRTLLQQELLQRGVLTFRGFMLPSLAHGEQELEETLISFRAALMRVRQATAEGSFISNLEIPLVV
jgi:glutamate-1-semialdehyde aminotransferase